MLSVGINSTGVCRLFNLMNLWSYRLDFSSRSEYPFLLTPLVYLECVMIILLDFRCSPGLFPAGSISALLFMRRLLVLFLEWTPFGVVFLQDNEELVLAATQGRQQEHRGLVVCHSWKQMCSLPWGHRNENNYTCKSLNFPSLFK